ADAERRRAGGVGAVRIGDGHRLADPGRGIDVLELAVIDADERIAERAHRRLRLAIDGGRNVVVAGAGRDVDVAVEGEVALAGRETREIVFVSGLRVVTAAAGGERRRQSEQQGQRA